jgi:hypothetical protein
MINWFAPKSWGAPVCVDAPRCDIPVGEPCGRCARPMTEHDEGVTMPGSDGPVTFHLTCQMKAILPHPLWPQAGLVPDAVDGLVEGRFECPSCGMVYIEHGIGWMRRLV